MWFEKGNHPIKDALVFDARCRRHMQHAIPHLVPSVETDRPTTSQFLVGNIYKDRAHRAIVIDGPEYVGSGQATGEVDRYVP